MAPQHHNPPSHAAAATGGRSSNEPAKARTDFAMQRTRMVADPSLMAWVRTSMVMGSLDVRLCKILQALTPPRRMSTMRSENPEPRSALSGVARSVRSMRLAVISPSLLIT
jgi:uncharacterized membrane protein YidH (DUF202 family)